MTGMFRLTYRPEEDTSLDDQAGADRQTESLAALALLLLLVVVGLFLVRVLMAEGVVEDCLMAGGHNCDAVLAMQALPSLW